MDFEKYLEGQSMQRSPLFEKSQSSRNDHQDSEIVKAKVERKSLALKAKKESSDEKCLTSGSEDEEYAMAIRDFKKFFKRRECPKPPKDKNQRAFIEGSWSDSGEEDDEKVNNETCLVAQASSEKKVSPDGGPINMGGPLNVQVAPKANMGTSPGTTPGSKKESHKDGSKGEPSARELSKMIGFYRIIVMSSVINFFCKELNDTFYNGLTLRHRDTINVAACGTFMKRRPEDYYDLIKKMTAHHNDWDTFVQR
nr:alpha/beta hydrolases superfamily protein [Tanacetum cinerariifolium]